MRLSFAVHGDELVSTIEVGTLSRKEVLAHRADRVRQLSAEVVEVLRRGNRVHTLSDNNLRDLRGVGQELFSLLVPPQVGAPLQQGAASVYLQVDEELVTVPWELLHDGERFWCQRFALGRAVATPQEIVGTVAPIPDVGPLRLLVVCADPGGDLPQVAAEGEQIVARLDATQQIDAHLLVDPTVEVVRRALKEHDLVHFAGHADHDPAAPERSGWRLRDGKLAAAEVRALGTGRGMPLLVFSNACRSGQTDAWRAGDDPAQVYGLANAFLLGGVRLYLGTQWEVVDGQSAAFAGAFYDGLCRGASAGVAVQLAREEIVRASGETALAWASYVLYGDPETLLLRPAEDEAAPRRTRIPSASALQARAAAPWKRPRPSAEVQATAPVVAARPRRRRLGATLAGGTLAGVAVAAAVLLLRSAPAPSPPPRDAATAAADQQAPATVTSAMERGGAGRVRPRVALLLDTAEPAAACLRRAIAQTKRFRLVDDEDIARLGAAQGRGWTRGLPLQRAATLAQSVAADIAVLHAPPAAGRAGELVALDVLTHDVLGRRTAGAVERGACEGLAAELLRVVHSEGRVVAKRGARAIVDLGWRSRVAPGVQLEVSRRGRVVGQLTVVEVQLDRCTAEGPAQVGDRVRLPEP